MIYNVIDGGNPPVVLVSSSVTDCAQLQESTLYKAIVKAQEAIWAQVYEFPGISEDETSILNIIVDYLVSMSLSTVLLESCEMSPYFAPCHKMSANRTMCLDCCEDFYHAELLACGIIAVWGTPIGGVLCGGVVYLAYRSCKKKCRKTFPS